AAWSDETQNEADAKVAAAVDELTETGVKAHGEVRNTVYGHAARHIVDDAAAHDVDVIVMGSRGRGDLAGLVLGSPAPQGIPLAHRPVLIVRYPTHPPAQFVGWCAPGRRSSHGPQLAHPSRSPRPPPGAAPGTTTTMFHRGGPDPGPRSLW